MADLLIRVVDNVDDENPYNDAALTKRGDVIVVCPDGWGWSLEETRQSFWRLLRWPGLSVALAQMMLAPEISEREMPLGLADPMIQARGWGLDLASEAWPEGFQAYLADDLRSAPSFDVGGVELDAVRFKKAPLPDLGTL